MKILILSTREPEYSANLGEDIYEALTDAGHSVDFVCRYSSSPNVGLTHRCLETQSPTLKTRIKNILRKIGYFKFSSAIKSSINQKQGDVLVYRNEDHPSVDPERLVNFIGEDNKYDVILTLFWFNMMNSTTLKKIYEVYKCPILIYSPDMAPMTGGCYYFGQCRNFTNGCGNCPLLENPSYSDQSKINYQKKAFNYSQIKKAFLGNTWMNSYALKSKLFSENEIFMVNIVINSNTFKPNSKEKIRAKYQIDNDDTVLMVRSRILERKRPEYTINSVISLYKNLSQKDQSKLKIISVGDEYIENQLLKEGISIKNFGKVNRDILIELYQCSDLFLSPSTDDAGPSMVNQAIMCGTPVVCLNIGTAQDVISNGISGFKTNDISSEGFTKLLESAYKDIKYHKYPNITETTRKEAIKYCSQKAFIISLENIFEKFYPTIINQSNKK